MRNKILILSVLFLMILGFAASTSASYAAAPLVGIGVPASAVSGARIDMPIVASSSVGIGIIRLLDSNNVVLAEYDCKMIKLCSFTVRLVVPTDEGVSYTYKAIAIDIYNQVAMASGSGVTKAAICGDVNGDGEVNVVDGTAIYRCALMLPNCNAAWERRADINADGKLTEDDVYLLDRYILGLEKKLPLCQAVIPQPDDGFVPEQEESSVMLTTFVVENADYAADEGQLRFFYAFKNNGNRDIEDITMSASIPELGLKAPALRVKELNADESVSRFQFIDLPKDIAPGTYYLALSINSRDVRRVVYREFVIS